jgi:hypothetical protein
MEMPSATRSVSFLTFLEPAQTGPSCTEHPSNHQASRAGAVDQPSQSLPRVATCPGGQTDTTLHAWRWIAALLATWPRSPELGGRGAGRAVRSCDPKRESINWRDLAENNAGHPAYGRRN